MLTYARNGRTLEGVRSAAHSSGLCEFEADGHLFFATNTDEAQFLYTNIFGRQE